MKNTKANVLKVLKEMEDSAYKCAKVFEEQGNMVDYKRQMGESVAYYTARQMFEDEEYFDTMAKIFLA